jgi:hypothetical protein
LFLSGGIRAVLEDLAVDIAFDINVANNLYMSPPVVTAESLADSVRRTTPFVQTGMQEGTPL